MRYRIFYFVFNFYIGKLSIKGGAQKSTSLLFFFFFVFFVFFWVFVFFCFFFELNSWGLNPSLKSPQNTFWGAFLNGLVFIYE
jgi:hypothetical protein